MGPCTFRQQSAGSHSSAFTDSGITPDDDLSLVQSEAVFRASNWHYNLRLNGRCEGTQIGWGGVLKKKRLDLTDWEKTRRRSNALANSYRSGNLWICSAIERYSSRKSAALDSN
jgi:hypothetical protein